MGQDPGEIREEIEGTRARLGDTVEAIGSKTDVKTRAKEKVTGTVESVRSKVGGAGSRVNEATPGREEVRRAAGVAQENPIGLALGSIAVGFLAGMLVPSTRVEDEKLGDVADQAKETAREAVERGKHVAREAAQSARATARESGREHAEQLKETAQQKTEETKQTAGS